MVNLNANRNLTPDSTPWGRAVEKRLNDLERENGLLRSSLHATSQGLSVLTTNVFDSGVSIARPTNTQYGDFTEGETTYQLVLEPVATGNTRTGRVLASGSVPLYLYNLFPVGSTYEDPMTCEIRVMNGSVILGSQNSSVPMIPRHGSAYYEVATSLPFNFVVKDQPRKYAFQLELHFFAPVPMQRCDVRIGYPWTLVTQAI